MDYQQGRLIDHVHLRVSDLARSRAFYRAVFEVLDLLDGWWEDEHSFCLDELFVNEAEGEVSKVHLAFQARDAATVERFHTAAIEAGGTDNGAPGRRVYHARYYGAFVLDPDGNNIEVVWHGPTRRTEESIAIERVKPSES